MLGSFGKPGDRPGGGAAFDHVEELTRSNIDDPGCPLLASPLSEPTAQHLVQAEGSDITEPGRVVDQHLAVGEAAAGADLDRLMKLLAPDVVFTGDGAGVVAAARHPVEGADRVVRFVLGLVRLAGDGPWELHPVDGQR